MVFNGNEMEIVNSYKYLGYTLTTKFLQILLARNMLVKQRVKFWT